MRKVATVLVLSVLLLAGGCSRKYVLKRDLLGTDSPWPYSRGELSSLGSVPGGSFNGRLDPVWESHTGGKPLGPLTIHHGALTFPDAKKQVSFYDTKSGGFLGRIKCKGVPTGGATIGDSLAFVGLAPKKERVFGYNLLKKDMLWKRDVKDASPGSIIVGNSLIVSSGNGSVVAFRTDSGDELWSFRAGGKFVAPASYADGRIYQPGDNGVLHVLSTEDGTELYADTLDGALVSPVAIADLTYVTDLKGNVYGLEPQTGERVWTTKLSGPLWTAPTLRDERVYVANTGGVIVALEATNGRQIWQYDAGEVVKTSPLAIGNYVVIGTAGGKIISLDAEDGQEVSRAQVRGSIDFAPVTDGTRIYVATSKGKIACFGEAYEYSNKSNQRDIIKDQPQ